MRRNTPHSCLTRGTFSDKGAEGRQNHSVLRSVGLLPVAYGGSHLRSDRTDAHSQGEPHTRSPFKAMSGITLEGKLYMTFQERAFTRERTRGTLPLAPDAPNSGQAARHLGRLSDSSRAGVLKDFLASGASSRVQLEQLPFSTLRISTPTKESGSTSNVWS